MKSSVYQPPFMAVSSAAHMCECTSCRGSVAWEVVFGVNGICANLHLMQLSQSDFPVDLGASVIVCIIWKCLRRTCTKWRCHNMCLSALCQDACLVVYSVSRQLSSILVYWVDSGALSRMNSPST